MLKPEGALQRKVLRSWQLSGVHLEHWPQQGAPRAVALASGREEDRSCGTRTSPKDSPLLRDHEIRASLTKHFGLLEATLGDEDLVSCRSPEYDTVFEDSSSGESSFLLEEEEGEGDDEDDEDSGLSPPRSDRCPYQSPPSKARWQLCSRSRSSSGSSSCRSWSPATRRTSRYGCIASGGMGGSRGTPVQRCQRREEPSGWGMFPNEALVLLRGLEGASSGTAVGKSWRRVGLLCES